MKSRFKVWCAVGLLLVIGGARGEGRCPLGQYPIGGQGVQGCAPIPNYGGTSQPRIPTPRPQPTGEWIKTWGAIANGTNGEGGVSVGKLSKHDAEMEAIFQCQRGGGVNCRPTFSYENQCVALTEDTGNGASSIERAQELAIDSCKKRGKEKCEIVYSACSEPIFWRYN
jgi:hypothetical protein